MDERCLFWSVNCAFLISGITQTLMAFEFDELGFAEDSSNFINAMGNPVGQFLFAAVDIRLWRNWERSLLFAALPIVVCELGCNLFSQMAIQKIGSGMYQVVYSFVVVMNAIPGHFCLGKPLNRGRWMSIMVVVLSIALAATAQLHLPGTDFAQQVLGCLAALLATMFVSAVYVASNWILEEPWSRRVPKPLVLAQMLGTMEFSIITIHFVLRVVPQWDSLVTAHMKPGVSPAYCGLLYSIYLIVCGVHQYAFYYSCSFGATGAVTAGINKCLQTTVLFFLSHILYCDVATSQCLSKLKVLGTFGVCMGVGMYAYHGAKLESSAVVPVNVALCERES
eukprot:TRINITY_DN18496_c0_g1_i2.p1 TRINITY_DN18496_c0_g1~~TRINITY_DN18496_c0_g1_i2.p1  ORF type:complete len:349 (-),score=31.89 TRINITY_DN18496_c0_g1_i2:116-1126(-)